MRSLISSCDDDCRVDDVSADLINSRNVNELYDQSVYLSDSVVPAALSFDSLQVGGYVETELVNGRNVSDYVTREKAVDFGGPVQVGGSLFFHAAVNVAGRVTGKKISSSTVLLRDGDQLVDWQLDAERVKTAELDVDYINKRKLDDYYDKAMTTGSSFALVQPFFRDSIESEALQLEGNINDVNLTEFYEQAMKTLGDQTVNGNII